MRVNNWCKSKLSSINLILFLFSFEIRRIYYRYRLSKIGYVLTRFALFISLGIGPFSLVWLSVTLDDLTTIRESEKKSQLSPVFRQWSSLAIHPWSFLLFTRVLLPSPEAAEVFGKNRARFLHHLMDYAGARTKIPVSTYSSCARRSAVPAWRSPTLRELGIF